jgi:fused signal recognition particle receptor
MPALAIALLALAFVLVVSGSLLAGTRVRRERRRHQRHERHAGAGAAVLEAPPPSASSAAPPAPAEELREAVGGLPAPAEEPLAPAEVVVERPVLRDRLGRARALLGGYLEGIRGKSVDDSSFEELEEALLLADVGVATTSRVLDDLRGKVRAGEIERTPEALLAGLRADLEALFEGDSPELHRGSGEGPTVWLFVGVNGVGKTTTIGKLAARETAGGASVVLAAGDTWRAAAGEQLETWSERASASLIRGSEGADPSSVIFDAVQHAAARKAELVMADTAGRLHTKVNLMEELRKVRRVAERPPGELTEVLLVLDATTGQNGLVQARQFTEAVGVTGVVLTKLDGTAKGGAVLAIRSDLGLPIKLVGVGEGIGDLVEFDPTEFVEALFS